MAWRAPLKSKRAYVGFYRKATGKACMTWPESVDQALCFGWIDGLRRSLDAERYIIRFTPRKPNSNWSNINIKKVETLLAKGLMQPSGIEAFSYCKAYKSGIYSYENKEIDLSPELLDILKREKSAFKFFVNQSASYQKRLKGWIMSAKQNTTFRRRLEKLINASVREERL